MRTGDLRLVEAHGDQVDLTIETLVAVIVAWSYPVPVTIENVDDQDQDWFVWLSAQVKAFTGWRDDESKKDLSENSSPITDPAAVPSLVNSST